MTVEEATEEIKRIKQGMQCDFGWNKSGIEALDMAIEALQTQLKESPENFNKDSVPESMFNADLISRQAALDACDQSLNIFEATERIKDLPAMKQERKVGKWKRVSIDKYVQHASAFYRCSECGGDHIGMTNFCSNCGAKMKEGE